MARILTADAEQQSPSGAHRAVIAPVVMMTALFLLSGLHDAWLNSAVADEVGGHLACGYLYWHSGTYTGGVANFPLGHLLIALPVAALGYSYELFTEQHLLLFRLPVLLLAAATGVFVYRFAAEVYDRRAGLAAMFLYCLSPNMLAHASLATLDVPIACFVFLTIYALWRCVRRPHWARMLALSVALSAALTTKVQALLLVPLIVSILALTNWRPAAPRRRPIPYWSWVFLLVVPYVLINAVYLNVPLATGQFLPALFQAALKQKLLHATGSIESLQVAYLCGEYSTTGWWYYFPFAILVKTPLPTLILLALGLLQKPDRNTLLFAILPAAAFLAVAMTSSLNIGLRHVLVIYPSLFMLAGRGATGLMQRSWRAVVLLILLVCYVGQAVLIAPHHISYFNIAAGGARHGHKLLIGSNYDSGQCDNDLRRYLSRRNLPYQINPDPFRPTTGNILVKANAFYGSYGNGGATAYWWLKRYQPVKQIAYTWFEYDLPKDAAPSTDSPPRRPDNMFRPWNEAIEPQERELRLGEIERHLLALRERFSDVTDVQYRFALGWAFVAVAAYDDFLDEMRLLLRQDPGFAPALDWGGECMVRWKVGTLKFEGTEYLTGFRDPAAALVAPPELPLVIEAARTMGITAHIARAHHALAAALRRAGRVTQADEQQRIATQLDPRPPGQPR
ncbi:MAG: glycosyltransferase family 39 protein [Planctomycetes bacterium]|nr:glycosyltransferase family 39 protein [Planctomycetota bacterium]